MKNNINIPVRGIFGLLILSGLIMLSLAAVNRKAGLTVQDVIVDIQSVASSHHLLTSADILSDMEAFLGPLTQLSLESIELYELEDILYFNPYIEDVNVYLSADHKLHLDIRERQPILRVIETSGQSYYVDMSGTRIPVSVHYTTRVPVATGIQPQEAEEGQLPGTVQDLFVLARKIHDDPFLHALIEQIHVESRYEWILIPKIGAERIRFGDLSRADDKLENLRIFYRKVYAQRGWNRYRELNLKYRDQVVCKTLKTVS